MAKVITRKTGVNGNHSTAVNVAALLRGAAKTTPSAKRKPANGDLHGHESLAQSVLDWDRKQKEAARELTLAKTQLREVVDPWHAEETRSSGTYEPTVKVGANSGCVRVTYQHRYTKVGAETEPAIRQIVGTKYDQFFGTGTTLKVRSDITDDADRLADIVQKLAGFLGAEAFQEIFECEQVILPTKAFTERRYAELSDSQNDRLGTLGVNQVVVVTEGR